MSDFLLILLSVHRVAISYVIPPAIKHIEVIEIDENLFIISIIYKNSLLDISALPFPVLLKTQITAFFIVFLLVAIHNYFSQFNF